jgi:hypothetical protein
MSSTLTKEQKNNIRKSLPLKIFERREESASLSGTIEYFNKMLSDLTMIKGHPDNASIELAWTDPYGEDMSASCTLHDCTDWFNGFKNDLAAVAKRTVEVCTKKLDDIPNAKIIPFDFRKKEVEPDRQTHPNTPPKKTEPKTILKGGTEISEAAGINYSEIKSFVDEKGMPAFKIPGRKFWYAFPEEIEKWKNEQEGAK